MPGAQSVVPYTCARCLRRQSQPIRRHGRHGSFYRTFSSTSPLQEQQSAAQQVKVDDVQNEQEKPSDGAGAMSRRLADMTDKTLESGGRTARKAVEEAGFSEEIKKRLEARIQDNTFRSENPAVFAQINMPSSAGKGTQQIATAQPWTGTETTEDAALRMLTDAYKPMRGPSKIPQPRAPAMSVDMRVKKAVQKSQGQRLANARDRTSVYALSQDSTLSEKEREAMRQQLKERFTSGARPMPVTLQGLAALANERIEDAIARGQFKNIARGKGTNVERDYTASSPFLDTTEYFMNKIIQKQEIVPPWIEKQQELVRAAAVFRSRLRADWKRHTARVIASKGGSLDEQVRRAEAYAAAEVAINPKKEKEEALSDLSAEGQAPQVTITESSASNNATKTTLSSDPATPPPFQPPTTSSPSPPPSSPPPPLTPFRDPPYLTLEAPYHNATITSLNTLTRSYNLLAPQLAQKPYFSLERELRSCFADVAPLLVDEIRLRSSKLKGRVEVVGHRRGGVMERFGGGREGVRVWDERGEKRYGWRELWRDWRGG